MLKHKKHDPSIEQEAIKPIKGLRSKTIERIIKTNNDALEAYIKIIRWQDPANDYLIPRKIANRIKNVQ